MSEGSRQIQGLEVARVYDLLHSRISGLRPAEVAERRLHVGPNSFEIRDPWKLARSFAKQFKTVFRQQHEVFSLEARGGLQLQRLCI